MTAVRTALLTKRKGTNVAEQIEISLVGSSINVLRGKPGARTRPTVHGPKSYEPLTAIQKIDSLISEAVADGFELQTGTTTAMILSLPILATDDRLERVSNILSRFGLASTIPLAGTRSTVPGTALSMNHRSTNSSLMLSATVGAGTGEFDTSAAVDLHTCLFTCFQHGGNPANVVLGEDVDLNVLDVLHQRRNMMDPQLLEPLFALGILIRPLDLQRATVSPRGFAVTEFGGLF